MENTKLLKKLANTYSKTTGLEFDDLFQEAYVAYSEAMKTYDPEKGALSTHIWHQVSGHLKNYARAEMKFIDPVISIEDREVINTPVYHVSFLECMSLEAQQILSLMFKREKKFNLSDKETASKNIKRMMVRRGWGEKKINVCLKEFELICQ